MILLVAFLLVVAVVPLLRGQLTRLATVELRGTPLLLGATVVQAVITQLSVDVPRGVTEAAHLASYLLAGGFVWINRRLPWLWLAALGGASNFVVIVANGGVMPASAEALALAGRSGTGAEFANSALIDSPRLWFLGDVFAVPASWPLANVFSIGDVVLLVGAALLVHRIAGSRLPGPSRGGGDAGPTRSAGRLPLLRDNPDFRKLWLAGASSDLGDWTYSLAVIAVLALQGASATVFASLIGVQMLASSVVGIVGTPIVDRVDRVRLLALVNLAQAATVCTLLVREEPAVAHLIVVGGVLGALGALVRPATMASIPNLVREEECVVANGYVSAAFNVAVSLGPVIGAGMVSTWGARPAFLFNITSFILSAALIARIRRRHVPDEAVAAEEGWFGAATAGVRHITARPPLHGLVVLMAFVVLGAALRAPVEPRFILNHLGGSAGAIGALASLWGLGMVLGSTVAVAAGRRWPLEKVLVASVSVLAVCIVSSSWLALLAPVAVLWLVAGSANALGSVAYESLLQQRTPDHLRGRVFGAAEAVLDVTYLVGAVAAGVIGALVGSRVGVGIAGIAVLVAAAYGILVFLRRPAGSSPPQSSDVADPAARRSDRAAPLNHGAPGQVGVETSPSS